METVESQFPWPNEGLDMVWTLFTPAPVDFTQPTSRLHLYSWKLCFDTVKHLRLSESIYSNKMLALDCHRIARNGRISRLEWDAWIRLSIDSFEGNCNRMLCLSFSFWPPESDWAIPWEEVCCHALCPLAPSACPIPLFPCMTIQYSSTSVLSMRNPLNDYCISRNVHWLQDCQEEMDLSSENPFQSFVHLFSSWNYAKCNTGAYGSDDCMYDECSHHSRSM